MVSEVANSDPTSTLAPGANSTPLGLERNTCPFALSRPKISEGLLPSTLLRATEEALGWLKLTQAFEPIENVCQLRIALLVAWSICIFDPTVEIVAVPEVTWPPVGSWLGAGSAAAGWIHAQGMSAALTASAAARGRVR